MITRATQTCALSLSLAALAGCAREPDSIELFFLDEVLEAPARSAEVIVYQSTECDAVLSLPHDASPAPGVIVTRLSSTYPMNPEHDWLANLPRGIPLVVAAAVFDASELVMARACEVVTLSPDASTEVRIEMHALPQCPDRPRAAVDVTIVLDTSTAMSVADTEGTHITELESTVIDGAQLPAGSTWSIIAHGHVPVTEVLAPTTDVEAVKSAIEALGAVNGGVPLVYDASAQAISLARARAVCGRVPAVLILLGGADGGSMRSPQDSKFLLVGAQGDSTDDIYGHAIGMNARSYDVLNEMIPENGYVTGAETQLSRRAAMIDAARALRALVE
ncbi:VWA domain-containing protein [Myxococcota bacterium]|nr:VWA domain-containing protein [Myxococcota bacterium]